jgi:hypothetical protein
MSSLEFGANRGELITVSLELVADGAITWVTG